jgi:hypothetical protein
VHTHIRRTKFSTLRKAACTSRVATVLDDGRR